MKSSNDNLVIQIAVAMILIALIGITVIRAKKSQESIPLPRIIEQQPQNTWVDFSWFKNADLIADQDTPSIETLPRLIENVNSDEANIVKEYFAWMESRDYERACWVLSADKCNAWNQRSIQLFSKEHEKLVNWYEYVNIKDLWFQSPSWKDIVCVKYSFRYKEDADPKLVSEVMSFYLAKEDGNLKIVSRVCEKKYKEGSWIRPCPVEPNARYCVGNVK